MNNMQPGQGRQIEKQRGRRYNLKSAAHLTGWLLSHTPKAGGKLAWILLLCVAISLINLAIPMLVGRAIDSLTDVHRLLISLLVLGFFYLVSGLLGRFQGIAVSRLAQQIGFELRGRLYRRIMSLPVSYTDTHPHGDIMSRMTNDIDAVVQTLSVVVPGLLSALITIVGCTLILFRQSPLITWVNLGVGAAMVLCGGLYSRLMFGLVLRQQKVLGHLNAVVAESMAHRRSISAYGRQKEEIDRMTRASDEMEQVGIRTQVFGAAMEPMMSVLGNISFLVTAVVGGLLVIEGTISIGMIQACLLYSRQLLKPVTEMGMLLSQIQGGLACADRVRALFDVPPEADQGSLSLSNARIQGALSFENLSFSYIRGKKVLDHLSLEIRPQETVALVGLTGAGKTTLMNLLLRFYEPDEGTLRLDGMDLRDIPRRRLYGSMAVILQDGSMMTDTIAESIAYGRPGASMEEIQAAAKQVCADTMIRQLPQGYETVAGPESSALSSGERQLICLARILLMDPRILILDEATSSVDARTEQLVQEALSGIRQGRTCIIIAHRLNTIRNVDRILMLDGGHIAEEGTHEQLMALRGKYYNLYMSGLSE